MSKKWIMVLVAGCLVLAACGSSQTNVATQVNPTVENALPPSVALNVQNQISQDLGVPVENIQIQNIEKMDWPNACLGLPQQDEACAEKVTPGWLLTFNIDNQVYKYRVDSTGTIVRQEP